MRLFLSIIFVVFSSVLAFAEMPDVTLTTPETVYAPATVYRIQGFEITRGEIKVYFNKRDASGNIVEQVTCSPVDWEDPAYCSVPQYINQTDCEANEGVWTAAVPHTDFTDLYTAQITAGAVGSKYIDKIARALENVCKGEHYLNYSGTSD